MYGNEISLSTDTRQMLCIFSYDLDAWLLNYSFSYWLLNEAFKLDVFHVSIRLLFIQVQLKSVRKTADEYQLAAFYWHMQYLEKEERRFGKYLES